MSLFIVILVRWFCLFHYAQRMLLIRFCWRASYQTTSAGLQPVSYFQTIYLFVSASEVDLVSSA